MREAVREAARDAVRWLLLRGDDGAWRVDGLYSEEPDEDDGASIWAQLEGVAEAAPPPDAGG